MGQDAFYGCSSLTSVTIPNSVTRIASSFYDCKGLTSVYISDLAAWCKIEFRVESANPLYYAKHMYLNGEEINDLVIPVGVTSIGGYAFYGYSGLTSVTIPNSVSSIGWYAFGNCSGLTSVTIPNSVSSIEAYAFAGCSGLTSVVIPNSVTSIGGHAFWRCAGLSSINIPNSVTKIEGGVFSECTNLSSINIPNSVTVIGSYSFNDSGLTSVTIPNSVTRIMDGAFYGCSGLTSVTIGNGVESIRSNAFANCIYLSDVYCYAEEVPYDAWDNVFEGSYIEYATLHIPNVSIESYSTSEPWSGFGKIVALTEDETGIDELKGENGTENSAVYDLSGRRVQKAQKGVYVQNGKVVLVR